MPSRAERYLSGSRENHHFTENQLVAQVESALEPLRVI